LKGKIAEVMKFPVHQKREEGKAHCLFKEERRRISVGLLSFSSEKKGKWRGEVHFTEGDRAERREKESSPLGQCVKKKGKKGKEIILP